MYRPPKPELERNLANSLIDLHCHILPGIDDGAPDLESSLRLARAMVAEGVRTVVATPHVNSSYANDPDTIAARTVELNEALARAGLSLAVRPGAELGMAQLVEMDRDEVARYGLGGSRTLLVESPYSSAVAFLEDLLFDLQARGHVPLLAHPERCPLFQEDPDRLHRLVDGGILCSLTAGAFAGRFGRTVRRFAFDLARDGLVHNISSDAHDTDRRPPGLAVAFESAGDLPGFEELRPWLTEQAPAALLEGRRPETPPALPERPRKSARGRFLGR